MSYRPERMWAFAWQKPWGNSITSIISTRRKECIKQITAEIGWTWPQLYRRGGRCIRVTVAQEKTDG